MNRKRIIPVAAVAALTIAALTACSSGSNSSSGSTSGSTKAPSNLTSISAPLSGQLGDKSFMDSANDGFQRADKDLGVNIKVVQAGASDAPAWERNLTQASASGSYGLIVTGGTVMASTLEKVAKQFPKQKYLIFDSPSVGSNVTGISYKQNESAFMAGALAALVTDNPAEFPRAKGTKKVGIAGGQDIPVIRDYIDGYTQGAKAVDPSITVDVRFINDFSSSQKGYDLATSMYDSGDDVVYQAAGAAGLGVLQAGQAAGRYSIGTDSNQNYLHPDSVLGSALKQVGNTVYSGIQSYLKGDLKAGATIEGNIANQGVGIAYNDKLVPSDITAKLDGYQKQIESGAIKVNTALQ
ncbi:MAG TPA: BMP family ABC transporter substrate-binding protein [Gryllotalpicola sp.]